jgi:hypothetical protein
VKTLPHIVTFIASKLKNLKCMSMKMMQIKEMENGYSSDSAIFFTRNSETNKRNSVVFACERGFRERESEVGE